MAHFLIRTAKNEIFGPMSRDAVVEKIRTRQIGIQDEVCAGNGYWIHLSETEELKNQLQIERPEDFPGELQDGEATATDTLTATLTATVVPGTPEHSETEQLAREESTGVFQVKTIEKPLMAVAAQNRSHSHYSQNLGAGGSVQGSRPATAQSYSVGDKDPMRFWKVIVLFIVFLLAVVLFRMLLLLP